MLLKYKDLTSEQKNYICNGCGGKGGLINPPDFLFKASCDHHDVLYTQGGTRADRKRADEAFYKYMKIDIDEADVWIVTQLYYMWWAYVYFTAVRLGGAEYFAFCSSKRTLEDVLKRKGYATT